MGNDQTDDHQRVDLTRPLKIIPVARWLVGNDQTDDHQRVDLTPPPKIIPVAVYILLAVLIL